MILVDTSAWIDFFRDTEPFAGAVDRALDDGSVALCGPIVTELRRGLRRSERARVIPLLDGCILLSQPDDLWTTAGDLGAALSQRGITAKTLDLLIATYAIAHELPILAKDGDFGAIARANLGLGLARP